VDTKELQENLKRIAKEMGYHKSNKELLSQEIDKLLGTDSRPEDDELNEAWEKERRTWKRGSKKS
jgi:hypothetical protein